MTLQKQTFPDTVKHFCCCLVTHPSVTMSAIHFNFSEHLKENEINAEMWQGNVTRGTMPESFYSIYTQTFTVSSLMLKSHQIRRFETLSPSSASVVQCRSDQIRSNLVWIVLLCYQITFLFFPSVHNNWKTWRKVETRCICNSF